MRRTIPGSLSNKLKEPSASIPESTNRRLGLSDRGDRYSSEDGYQVAKQHIAAHSTQPSECIRKETWDRKKKESKVLFVFETIATTRTKGITKVSSTLPLSLAPQGGDH